MKQTDAKLNIEMRDAYFLIQDAKIQMLSSSKLAKSGINEDEIVGMPFTSIFPMEVYRELLEAYEELVAGKTGAERIKTHLMASDGSNVPIEISVWPAWHRGKPAVAGIVLDMTERESTEKRLRQSEEKLKVMLESIADGIAVIDFESRIQDMNLQMLRFYGYERKEEVIGRSAFEFIPIEYRPAAIENMKKALKEGQGGNLEMTLVTKDGQSYEVEISGAPLRDKAGRPVGFIAITRDITERKRQEAENVQLQETLKFYSNQVVKASKELVHAIREVELFEGRISPPEFHSIPRRSNTVKVELLTQREIQVLQLASRGLSNKSIGMQLGITIRTVKGHLMNIFGKMKVKSRTEAISMALKEGWITLEDMS